MLVDRASSPQGSELTTSFWTIWNRNNFDLGSRHKHIASNFLNKSDLGGRNTLHCIKLAGPDWCVHQRYNPFSDILTGHLQILLDLWIYKSKQDLVTERYLFQQCIVDLVQIQIYICISFQQMGLDNRIGQGLVLTSPRLSEMFCTCEITNMCTIEGI